MNYFLLTLMLFVTAIGLAACSSNNLQESTASPSSSSPSSSPPPSPQPTAEPVTTSTNTNGNSESLAKIVAFGDSLTAGYGLAASESYPSLLQGKLDRDGYKYKVVNAGVSGDTSAGGLRRIDWALEGDVAFVILELGANDILRGQPISEMRKNLSQIIKRTQAHGAEVLLAGMISPTNAGSEYQREIYEAFQSLAREHKVPLIPFFLDRVAGIESLNLNDGAHPNAEGTKIVAETVYQALRPLLDKEQAASKR